MEMVRHQSPGVQPGSSRFTNPIRQPFQEAFPVIIVAEDVTAFYPSPHDVVN
jgi:hypothetical protein